MSEVLENSWRAKLRAKESKETKIREAWARDSERGKRKKIEGGEKVIERENGAQRERERVGDVKTCLWFIMVPLKRNFKKEFTH